MNDINFALCAHLQISISQHEFCTAAVINPFGEDTKISDSSGYCGMYLHDN